MLAGKSEEPTLLPIIYEAAEGMAWDSEEAATAANPSMGQIVNFEQLAPQLAKAREDPTAESEYKRLYLSRWTQDGGKNWLDVSQWDNCTGVIDPAKIKDARLYVGVDLSQGDDLCAAVFEWVTAECVYIRGKFWLPIDTAEKYEKTEAVPYTRWKDEGAIELIPETTINKDVRGRIAAHIIAIHKIHKIKAVCYDRYKADEVIAILEGRGLSASPSPRATAFPPDARSWSGG